MESTGLMEALQKLKVALKGASLQGHRVRTFAGVFEAQKAADGRPEDYQTWLEYALNADLKNMIESRYSSAAGVEESVHDPAILAFIQKFHRAVVDSIDKLAGKMNLSELIALQKRIPI